MTKKEIKKRTEELRGKIEPLKAKGKERELSYMMGEINGLDWVLTYWKGYYAKS